MALKIKGSDDRVRGAITAILLVGRARLARGERENLVPAALAEYRADPEGYKLGKRTWPPPTGSRPSSRSPGSSSTACSNWTTTSRPNSGRSGDGKPGDNDARR